MEFLEKYGYTPNAEEIEAAIREVKDMVPGHLDRQTLMNCFSMMDLTTLKSNDTPSSVKAFVGKVSQLAGWPS